jgi:hypothetical protein
MLLSIVFLRAILTTSPLILTLAKHYDDSDAGANIFRRWSQHCLKESYAAAS